MTVIDRKFHVRRIQSTYYRKDLYGLHSNRYVFYTRLFFPALDLHHITILSPVHSKTDFGQFARTLRDSLHETCLIGVPSIDRGWAVVRILNLCLGCTQSQLVSNEPTTDINRSYLDLNKRQHNQHCQKQKLGTENLGGL